MAHTKKRDEIEQAKFKAKSATRGLVTIAFNLVKHDILNEMIPAIDDAVDEALANGESWELDVHALVDNVERAVRAAGTLAIGGGE